MLQSIPINIVSFQGNFNKMLTFRQFLENIQGEYWIDQYGGVQYADGNIGDYNHEGYVISQLQAEIADKYNPKYNRGEYVDWEKMWADIMKKYQKKYPKIQNETELLDVILDDLGVSNEEYSVANGVGDARLYGMKNWGWKRVEGNNVETWNLTAKDMTVIADGIEEILSHNYDEETPDSEIEIFIHVYSVKKDFEYTLEQLKNGGTTPIKPGTGFDAKQTHHTNAAQNYLAQQKPSNSFYKGFAEWLKNR